MTEGDTATNKAAMTRRARAKLEQRHPLIDTTINSIAANGLSGTTLARMRDAEMTASGLEAPYDGLWPNLLPYPDDFRRIDCRQRAVKHLVALFPTQIDDLPKGTAGSGRASHAKDQTYGPEFTP